LIPLLDLKAQYQSIKPEIDAAVTKVLESGSYVLGEPVREFEAEFARFCGATEAVALNSGTSALHLALLAAGIGPGDEVITVPFTFIATVSAIVYTGARPVLVDVDSETLNIDVAAIERAITPRTKAVIPVHLYGNPARMDEIMDVARRYRLTVIEDAAQAHGAEYKGKRVGGIGDMGCFSFYPGKNLGAYGEGGAVVTNNPEDAAKIRMLRDWGQDRKYHHPVVGYNYRMDAIQGAILGVKLRHLERWTEMRRAHAALYGKLLGDAGLRLPPEARADRHVYHQYTIRIQGRDRLQNLLTAEGIQTGIHYPVPLHLQPVFAGFGYGSGDFPVSESAAQQVLSLPVFPEMTRSQVETVAALVGRHVLAGAAG
jgi:dTDP-4-amino-4,6-dideoxygalactose transaminase